MKTTIAIATAGAIGLITILQTALYYAGVDSIALSITMLMGLALALGVTELLWVAKRTERLRAELLAFPSVATYDHVSQASPLLRALLSARLDRTSLPVPGPVFAPFLIGLLVMLGLLGTFLGLFETLRGAGQALTASADVEALRAGLTSPIQGLMRGFGTSAAGVASSAMLGIAAVFVRRDSSHLSVRLHATTSGPLARYSPSHRQLVALEQLAEQGAAWPKAAAALNQAVETLQSLQTDWARTHAEAAQQTQAALRNAAEAIGDTIQKGVGRAAEAGAGAVRPLLQQGVTQIAEAASAHLVEVRALLAEDAGARQGHAQRLAEHLEGQLQALDARSEDLVRQRQRADEAQLQAMAHTLDTLEQGERTRASAGEARAAQLHAELTRGHAELHAQLANAHAELLERLNAHREEIARQEQLGHAQLANAHAELLERLDADRKEVSQQEQLRLKQLAEQEAERVRVLTERLTHLAEQAAERDTHRAAALAQLGDDMQKELVGAATLVRERLQDNLEHDKAQHARVETLFAHLSEASQTIAAAAQEQVGALQQFAGATEGRIQAAEARSQERLEAVLARLLELAEQQSTRLASFEQTLIGQHEAAGATLSDRFAARSELLERSLQQTADLVQQAATLVHGGGVELSAVAESFGAAVEKQREGARAWLESLGEIERAVVDAGEAAAADVLGQHLVRTHEIFDRQLQFQQELIEQLRSTPRPSMVAMRADAAG